MPVEEALTYIIAVSVPVWLAVEQVLVRRRAARERQRQAAAADRSNLLAARSVNPSPHGTESSRRAA